jgi:hypothetical protein
MAEEDFDELESALNRIMVVNCETIGYLTGALEYTGSESARILDLIERHSNFIVDQSKTATSKPSAKLKPIK